MASMEQARFSDSVNVFLTVPLSVPRAVGTTAPPPELDDRFRRSDSTRPSGATLGELSRAAMEAAMPMPVAPIAFCGVSAVAVSSIVLRTSFFTLTVAFSMLEAPRVRR